MTKPVPSNRRSLNDKQLFLLKAIRKFRFVTIPLLVKSQGKKESSAIHDKLERLRKAGYLDRIYDGKTKITGQPAQYFLTAEGIRLLKGLEAKHHKALDNMYKNLGVHKPFRSRCLNLFEIYIQLKHWYAPNLNFFTKNELSDYDYFPKRYPDAYFIRKTPDGDKEYMLDIYDGAMQYFAISNKIRSFIRHYEQQGWKGAYPTLLFVCDTPGLERSVQRFTARTLTLSANEELLIKTTSLKALLNAASESDLIWSNVLEPQELTTL